MANEQNLRPIRKGELSKEEAKKRGRKGRIERGEMRRRAKSLREGLQALFDRTYEIDGEKTSGYYALCIAMLDQAKNPYTSV